MTSGTASYRLPAPRRTAMKRAHSGEDAQPPDPRTSSVLMPVGAFPCGEGERRPGRELRLPLLTGFAAEGERLQAHDVRDELCLTRMVGWERRGERRDAIAHLQGEMRRRGTDHLREFRFGGHRVGVLSDAHTADVATGRR